MAGCILEYAEYLLPHDPWARAVVDGRAEGWRKMNIRRSWIIARKDIAEFKRNRFVLYTLIITPLMMAVILPIATVVPMRDLLATAHINEEFDYGAVHLPETYMHYNGTTISVLGPSPTIDGARIEDAEIDSLVANSSIVRRSRIGAGVFRGTLIENCTITSGTFVDCTLLNTTVRYGLIMGGIGNNVTVQDVRRVESDIYALHLPEEIDAIGFYMRMLDSLLVFFLMIPAIIPTVIASYSLVGEKNNKSLEPLLATPASDLEIMIGKMLAAFVPSILATFLGFALFAGVLNYLLLPVVKAVLVLDTKWLLGIFVLAPLFCVLGIIINIFISTKVADVRASQQLGALVVTPLVALFIISSAGIFTIHVWLMLVLCAVIGLMDLLIFRVALGLFDREAILVRWS
ncbi:MAG: ABC transporter permease subunit [Candidatus Thermoplasmatota archaeon]